MGTAEAKRETVTETILTERLKQATYNTPSKSGTAVPPNTVGVSAFSRRRSRTDKNIAVILPYSVDCQRVNLLGNRDFFAVSLFRSEATAQTSEAVNIIGVMRDRRTNVQSRS